MPLTRPSPSVAIHGLFVAFGVLIAAFFPFLAIYLDDKGLSAREIGLVIAVMAVARMLLLPAWGHIADTRTGRVTAMQVGLVGAIAGGAALALAHGPVMIAIVAFALAAFMVSTGPNVDAIALVHLGAERMSDYGRIRGWESLSYAAACVVFGIVFERSGVGWAMPIFALSGVGVLAWSTTVRRDRPKAGLVHGRMGAVGAVFREAPRFWGFLVALLILWTGFNAAWNFIGLKIERAGGGPLLVAVGAALGGLVEVPVMRLSSKLQRAWGLRRVYVMGCGIYAVGFLLWGLVSDPTIVSLLTVFEGLAFGFLFTTGIVVIGKLLPSTLYSTGNSLAGMVGFGIAPIIGAGVGGWVFGRFGPTTLYVGASCLAVAGGIAAWVALSTPALSEPLRGDDMAPTVGIQPEPGMVP